MESEPRKIPLRPVAGLSPVASPLATDTQSPAGPPPAEAASGCPAPGPVSLHLRRLDKQEIVIPDPPAPASAGGAEAVPEVVPPVGATIGVNAVPHAGSPFRNSPGMRSSMMPAVVDGVPKAASPPLAVHRQKVEMPAQFSVPPARPPERPPFTVGDALALSFTVLCIAGAYGVMSVMPMVRMVAVGGEFPWHRLAVSLIAPCLVILALALRKRLLTLVVWGLMLLAVLAAGGLGGILLVARELLVLPPAQLVLLPTSGEALGGALLLAAALFLVFGGGPIRWSCGVLVAVAGVAAPFVAVETWAADWFGNPTVGRSAAVEVMAEGVAVGGVVNAGGRYIVTLPTGWNIPSPDARPALIWAPPNPETVFARDDQRVFVVLWRERPVAAPIQVAAFADARLASWRRQLAGCQGMTSNPLGKHDRCLVYALAGGEVIEELCVSDGANGVYVLSCRGDRTTVQALRKELDFLFNGFSVSPTPPVRPAK